MVKWREMRNRAFALASKDACRPRHGNVTLATYHLKADGLLPSNLEWKISTDAAFEIRDPETPWVGFRNSLLTEVEACNITFRYTSIYRSFHPP